MGRKKIRKIAFTFCISFVAVVLMAGSVLISSRMGCVREPGVIYVTHGTTYAALLDSLTSGKKIRCKKGFDIYAKHIGLDSNVHSGRYELVKGMSYVDVARMFNLGLQTPINITFNNARDPYIFASKLAPQIELDSATIVEAFGDRELQQKVGVSSAREMFGLILPNTYEVYWDITAEEFFARMRREYD